MLSQQTKWFCEMFLGFSICENMGCNQFYSINEPQFVASFKKQAQNSQKVYQISPLDMDDISAAESSLPNTPSLIKLTLALGSAEGSVNCI